MPRVGEGDASFAIHTGRQRTDCQ
jgi:hypothetical protein